MGRKAPKPSKAAANSAGQAPAAEHKQQKGQAGSKKAKRDIGYDSLHDPLDRELALVGLRVKQVTADGNCFFRALSDQLEGSEAQHSSLRARIVAFMKEKEEDFAPFVEDDQSFEAYIARMRKEGTWGGHMELQAASLLLQVNIVVYQAGQPRWAITNFPLGTRKLHLSYHDGEHYNSVRRAGDYSPGPPEPLDELLTVDTAAQLQSVWSAADESKVAAGTGCDNPLLIRQQLEAAHGDVDAAIEAIIEVLAAEDVDSTTAAAASLKEQKEAEAQTGSTYPGQSSTSAGFSNDQQVATAAPGDLSQQCRCTLTAATAAVAETENERSAAPQNSTAAQSGAAAVSATELAPDQQAATHAGDASSGTKQQLPAIATGKHKTGGKLKGGSKQKHGSKAGDADDSKKPSRNKPCPCGSGRKHKNCCGLRGTAGSSNPVHAVAGGLPVMLDTLHI